MKYGKGNKTIVFSHDRVKCFVDAHRSEFTGSRSQYVDAICALKTKIDHQNRLLLYILHAPALISTVQQLRSPRFVDLPFVCSKVGRHKTKRVFSIDASAWLFSFRQRSQRIKPVLVLRPDLLHTSFIVLARQILTWFNTALHEMPR